MNELLEELKGIDENEYGLVWGTPYSAIPGHNCYIYLAGCHITADRGVALCPEMEPVASLKEYTLKEITSSIPFIRTRHIEKYIEGHCKDCDILMQCFGGCRSKAYYEYNSYFASDPFCYYIKDSANKGCRKEEKYA